jgi:hypothetical protein
MTFETSPEPGRAVMTAREAARVLRKDHRTVQRMIQDGDLDGGADPSGQRRRWYVYTDQIGPSGLIPHRDVGAAVPDLLAENERLREENTDLRARLLTSEESYRLLLASQATMREALTDYQSSVDELLAGTTGFREAAGHFQNAAAGLQASNSKLNAIIGSYSDALHQHLIPGHPGSLMTGDSDSPLPGH